MNAVFFFCSFIHNKPYVCSKVLLIYRYDKHEHYELYHNDSNIIIQPKALKYFVLWHGFSKILTHGRYMVGTSSKAYDCWVLSYRIYT